MADHPSDFNNRASPPQSREENQNRQEPLIEENHATLDTLPPEIRHNIMLQAQEELGRIVYFLPHEARKKIMRQAQGEFPSRQVTLPASGPGERNDRGGREDDISKR